MEDKLQKLWCWRCKKEVVMLNETEFEEFYLKYRECMNNVKEYRKTNNKTLSETPLAKFYAPAIIVFEKITNEKVTCSYDHLLKHRLSLYGDICKNCGTPFRTPKARFCVNCGNKNERK